MRFTTTLAAAAALAVTGAAATAGGLADEIMEAPVVVAEPVAPATSSISPTYVVLGVLAALLIAAAVAEDDDDDAPTMEETLPPPVGWKPPLTFYQRQANGLPFFASGSSDHRRAHQQWPVLLPDVMPDLHCLSAIDVNPANDTQAQVIFRAIQGGHHSQYDDLSCQMYEH